jgi:putative transcriptional regulator
MAIRLNLDRMLVERRLTLTELAERVGISLVNLSILKNNKARAIRFTTLDALCRALECQPADLLEHVDAPASPESTDADAGSGEPT